jgi:hypothetical protein
LLTNHAIHVATTQNVLSFASKAPTKTRLASQSNRGNEVAPLPVLTVLQHRPPHLDNVGRKGDRYGLLLASASSFHIRRTEMLQR